MALDLQRLELVKRMQDGSVKARCPACAQEGGDRKGEHLLIYSDDRYGCCVHPKDRQHRRRIFALAADRTPRLMTVKVKLHNQASVTPITEAVAGVSARTPISYPRAYREDSPLYIKGFEQPVREATPATQPDPIPTTPDPEPPQPASPAPKPPPTPAVDPSQLPFIDSDGVLIVPFGAPERYSWWADGQTAQETIEEVRKRMKEQANGCEF